MGSANEPVPTPTPHVQAEAPAAPAEPAAIPLPPPRSVKQGPSPERVGRQVAVLDGILVGLVVMLAVFLASFAARNSDLWMHLAVGRLLAQGQYQFGTDPFSFATHNVYWANHAWLYGLGLYGLYSLAGGPALVIAKAVVVVALAALMLAVRRPGQSLLLPVCCTALALLVLSPRLLLQPTVFSFLFLAATLWLLQRPRREDAGSGLARFLGSPRRLWLLVPLFLLWVNVDVWFLLGPLTVALWLVGALLQQKLGPAPAAADAPAPGEVRTLALALLAGLAACLLNPHHYHAFTLPEQLPFLVPAALRQEPSLRLIFVSPLSEDYFLRPVGYNPAGLAYFALVLLGVASFILNRSARHWGRALVWLALLGLSAYFARAIPFFAVAAGPIAALNLQDFAARRFGVTPPFPILPRVAAFLVGLIALALAWPGWLHGPPYERWRVAWQLESDSSMEAAARYLDEVPEQGQCLNLHPDLANYMAWHCPGHKSFFDYRFQLVRDNGVAEDWATARKRLGKETKQADEDDWQGVLRRRGAALVLVSDDYQVMQRLMGDPRDRWTLLHPAGRVAVLAWNDPQQPGRPWEARHFDPDRAAFGKKPETAPATWPGHDPEPPSWWEEYAKGPGRKPRGAFEARLHLTYFQARMPQHVQTAVRAWSAGSIISEAVPVGGPVAVGLRVLFGVNPRNPLDGAYGEMLVESFLAGQDKGPSASALLAVRAARRAIAANPASGKAWFQLGVAYSVLLHRTREVRWSAALPLLHDLRYIQQAAAFRNAVLLEPADPQAHGAMAHLFEQMSYRDLALKHRTEELRLQRERGRPSAVSEEEYNKRLDQMEKDHQRLETIVKRAQDEFILGRERERSIFGKAALAVSKGLHGQALDLLLQSEEVLGDPRAIQLELDLLLRTGQLNDLRLGLTPARKGEWVHISDQWAALPLYEWYSFLLAAASGDYRAADRFLADLLPLLERPAQERFRSEMFQALSGHSLVMTAQGQRLGPHAFTQLHSPDQFLFALDRAGGPMPKPLAWYVAMSVADAYSLEHVRHFPFATTYQADIWVMRGLLALEIGDNEAAKRHFRQSLAVWFPPQRGVAGLAALAGPGGLERAAVLLALPGMVTSPKVDYWGRPIALHYLRKLE